MTNPDKKSAWEIYKENLGSTRPWDLLNPKTQYVSEEESEARFSICKECPFYIKATHQCKKCGCIMNLKTKLLEATCPEHKW
jgi:Family of unknown function (DUF6171)